MLLRSTAPDVVRATNRGQEFGTSCGQGHYAIRCGPVVTITTHELLDSSSANLRTLAAFLAEQLDENVAGADVTVEVRACREVLRSLRALIPKIEAVTRAPAELPRSNRARTSMGW